MVGRFDKAQPTAAVRSGATLAGGAARRPIVQLPHIRTLGFGADQISPVSSSATTQIRWCSCP